jgi:ketosteroid isomerase-like protein
MNRLALIAVLLTAPASALAQTAEHPPCWHAEFDAFSFLPGAWTVRAEDRMGDGKWETTEARCWFTKEMKGCMIGAMYVGTRAGNRFEGRGYYGFNNVSGKLQHMWIDDEHGMLTTYEGQKVGDTIVLDYAMVLRGQPTVLRDVYSDISKDAFRMESSRSNDGGKTWLVTSKLAFTREPVVEVAPLPSVELPAELARVLTDYEAGWQAKDEVALAALFAEDGFVLPGGNPPVRGRDAIQQHYKDAGGPLSLRALAYATQGDTGYIVGAYARAKGEPDAGKFTLTLRKDKSGRWLIVSDMDNSNRR